MKKVRGGRRWMDEHVNDPFVQRARVEGYRSRAAFKLVEIDVRDKLIQPGQIIVDLGAAPGSWAQVAAAKTQMAAAKAGRQGRIIALDVLAMEPIANVEFIQGDFTESAVLRQIEETLGGAKVDLVLSDLAPNISGISVSDQARSMVLCELALDFSKQWLQPGGGFLVKVFQGAGFQAFLAAMRANFVQVATRKPAASRGRSSETYLLARGVRSQPVPPTED